MGECPTGEEPDRGLENEVPCRVQARGDEPCWAGKARYFEGQRVPSACN